MGNAGGKEKEITGLEDRNLGFSILTDVVEP
jgi:hypothetical protein